MPHAQLCDDCARMFNSPGSKVAKGCYGRRVYIPLSQALWRRLLSRMTWAEMLCLSRPRTAASVRPCQRLLVAAAGGTTQVWPARTIAWWRIFRMKRLTPTVHEATISFSASLIELNSHTPNPLRSFTSNVSSIKSNIVMARHGSSNVLYWA